MRGKRTRLATGVYRDAHGIALVLSVNGEPREFRRDAEGKPYAGRDLQWLRTERANRKALLALQHDRIVAKGETFAADVPRFLNTIVSLPYRKSAESYLKHWTRVFGDRHRNDITEVEIQTTFAQITKSASTKNHLRHILIRFYDTLNGKLGPNPARVLKQLRRRYEDARALPYETITAIFDALGPSKAKARLMLMAYVGLPQTQIAKLQRQDIDLQRRTIYVRPRRKGAGVAGRTLPLSAAGVAACKAFIEQSAFGSFRRSQVAQVFANGITWSKVTVPAGTRPYDLRHSFLTEVYRQTGDLRAVAELGMHATLEQTARYAQGAVSERAASAIQAVPRFSNRGTPAKGSNSFQFVPAHLTGQRGSNQYRKRAKQGNSQRKRQVSRS